MRKTNNELVRQFDNHFRIKKLESGWYGLAGYWIVNMESGWMLHNANPETPAFLAKQKFYKSDVASQIRLVYIAIWRAVEEIEHEQGLSHE